MTGTRPDVEIPRRGDNLADLAQRWGGSTPGACDQGFRRVLINRVEYGQGCGGGHRPGRSNGGDR